MSKKALKMSKTYCYIGFEGWVVNILNTVLNNFYRKVEYTNCIIFRLSFLTKSKMFTEIVKNLYSFLAIISTKIPSGSLIKKYGLPNLPCEIVGFSSNKGLSLINKDRGCSFGNDAPQISNDCS